MGFEDLLAIVEGFASMNDWRRFGSVSHCKTAAATAMYGLSLLAAFPLCMPGEDALCQVPSHSYFDAIATSASSVESTGPAVDILSGNVITTSTDGTGRLYTMHKPS